MKPRNKINNITFVFKPQLLLPRSNTRFKNRLQLSPSNGISNRVMSNFLLRRGEATLCIRSLVTTVPPYLRVRTLACHDRSKRVETRVKLISAAGWGHVTVQSARDSLQGSEEKRNEQEQPPPHPVSSTHKGITGAYVPGCNALPRAFHDRGSARR